MTIAFRYHGNWVGPGWSAGKYQPSTIDPRVPAIDEFDQTGKDHDAAYAPGADPRKRTQADLDFGQKNFGKGIKRTAAALAVGAQALVRDMTLGYVDMSGPSAPLSFRKKMSDGATTSKVSRKRKASASGGKPPKKAKKTKKSKKAKRSKTKRVKKRTARSGKMPSFKSAYKLGVVEKTENGGTASAGRNSALYIGHSGPVKTICNLVSHAIIKKLFDLAGIKFTDWRERLGDVFGYRNQLEYLRVIGYYRTDANTMTGQASTIDFNARMYAGTVVQSTTIKNFAEQLILKTEDINPDEVQNQSFKWISFSLLGWNGASDATQLNVPLSHFQAEQASVEVGYTSTMRIQNRTNDSAATATGNLDSNTVNPLIAKLYDQTHEWANGFDISKSAIAGQASNTQNLYANVGSGLILADQTFQPDNFKKLPPKWVIGADSAVDFVHNPGDIKVFSHSWTAAMNLNTIYQKVPSVFFSGTSLTGERVAMGKAQCIGYEMAINDRTETSDITVSYEIDSTAFAIVKLKSVRLLPILSVA